MAFVGYKGVPDDASDFQVRVGGNSLTFIVGDAIIAGGTGHNKAVLLGVNTTGILIGVVTAILNAQYAYTGLNSVATGASNETTAVYYIQFYPLTTPGQLFKATLDAVAGTTTGSDGMGWFNISATATKSGYLGESSIAFMAGTAGQFWSWGLDPTDSTNFTVIGSFAKGKTP